ncbi:S1 RNA-binding domain-containing protein [Paenibacillus sp. PsM32]|uniref:S1 RNA-binding domain-containing protein n=1 Tax=unclassified Paenibacillus TaxID=185978 RepID=UPI0023664552|nr:MULTISPECIES: S1 RNA-binding domain-containing protein [unclassified Paenibacillus]MDN4617650.1 S1 RNA-binding domain-containing protein [Paenibacillus sp. PsM32]WDF52894.1 S1 RNA-binding domain-containing protein [Paenibacillus sp. KACC 21273]
MSQNELKRVLIEGYDEKKLQQSGYDEAWAQIYSAKQNNLILQAELIGMETKLNKLCGVVQVGEVRGLIPQEYAGVTDPHAFRRMLGEPVAFKIVSYDRDGKTFIASRQAAIEHMETATWKWLEKDAIITAVVRSVSVKQMTVDIGGIEVDLPVQHYAHGWTEDLREVVEIGDHFKVKVLELDKENKSIVISRKALEQSPWPDCSQRYNLRGEYIGRVSGIAEYGVFVNLERGVDALVRHMAFDRLRVGDKVSVRIIRLDVKKQQIFARITRKR